MRIPDLGLDRTSSTGRVPRWLWVALLAAAFIWLVGPRVSGWQLLHLHKEDGDIFLEEWVRDGWRSLFHPYTGYQHLGPRTLTAACATGPVSWFAPCVGASSGVVRFLLALVAAAVLAPYARTRAWGIAAGFLFVFVPVGSQEVLGNFTNLRWFFDVGCFLVCIGLFLRSDGRPGGHPGILVGAMTDPLVILLIPIAAWRVASAQRRVEALPALAVAAGAVVQWLLLVPSARPTDLGWFVSEPLDALSQILVRGGAVAQYGQNGTEVVLTVSVVLAALAGLVPVALIVLARPVGSAAVLSAVLVLAALALLAATLVFAPRDLLLLDPAYQLGNGSRYAVGPAILIGAAVLVAASYATSRLWRWTGATLLVLGALADLTGDAYNTQGPTWVESVEEGRASCVDGVRTVDLQLTPTGVPLEWTAELRCDWLSDDVLSVGGASICSSTASTRSTMASSPLAGPPASHPSAPSRTAVGVPVPNTRRTLRSGSHVASSGACSRTSVVASAVA